MLAHIFSAVVIGIEGHVINVEVDVDRGLPSVLMTGLGDAIVKEATFRCRRAISNSGYTFPRSRVVINLLPPWMHKHGSQMDLAIAVGILIASNQINVELNLAETVILGELSLDGNVNGTKGILPMLMAAKKFGIKKAIIPRGSMYEASFCKDVELFEVSNLREAVLAVEGKKIGSMWYRTDCDYKELLQSCYNTVSNNTMSKNKIKQTITVDFRGTEDSIEKAAKKDFSQIKGQEACKLALVAAVSGGHNILLRGNPGTGKSMMAERICTIMPRLSEEEYLQIMTIYSSADKLTMKSKIERPFRSPGSSSTRASLIGGGVPLKLGEITLAHRGVLFLDEINQFENGVLQALREPMEDKMVVITRQGVEHHLPADFMLVAAANPCPCGYRGHPKISCKCSEKMIRSYNSKLSGPLLDRIDMYVDVATVDYEHLTQSGRVLDSKSMLEMVEGARDVQLKRQGNTLNGNLLHEDVERYCCGTKDGEELLREGCAALALSPRGVFKIRKVARTLADLDKKETIEAEHFASALAYRERVID